MRVVSDASGQGEAEKKALWENGCRVNERKVQRRRRTPGGPLSCMCEGERVRQTVR